MTPFPPPKLQYKLAIVDIQQHRQSRLALWRSCFMVGCIFSLGLLTASPFWKSKNDRKFKLMGID